MPEAVCFRGQIVCRLLCRAPVQDNEGHAVETCRIPGEYGGLLAALEDSGSDVV